MPDEPTPTPLATLDSAPANVLTTIRQRLGVFAKAESDLEFSLNDVVAFGLAPTDAQGSPPAWLVPYIVDGTDARDVAANRAVGSVRGTDWTWTELAQVVAILYGMAGDLGANGKAKLNVLLRAKR